MHGSGGRGGIRTHGWLAPSPVFKTGALNRSATLPGRGGRGLYAKQQPESTIDLGRSERLGVPVLRWREVPALAQLWHIDAHVGDITRRVKRLAIVSIFAASVSAAPACAQDEAGFQTYLQQVRGTALAQGVSRTTLDSVLPTLTLNSRVIELDRRQPGGPANSGFSPFAPYKAAHVDAARIGRGGPNIWRSAHACRGSSVRPASRNRSWSRSGA